MKILIAEDDRVTRRMLEKTLTRLGHETVSASDGEEAWQAFRRDPFDLVLSDWVMPVTDGLELCRRVRGSQTLPHYVYFVLLTGRTGRENFLEGMHAGADDYIVKPLDLQELEARLLAAERVLDIHHRVRRLEGLLPICSYCKRVREDEDLWAQIEEYVSKRSAAVFSHAICPECYRDRVEPMVGKGGAPVPVGSGEPGSPPAHKD